MIRLAQLSVPLATAVAAAIAVVACSGKNLSLGSNAAQAEPVTATSVTGNVGPCPAGSAHPNVCCAAAPGVDSACADFPNAPFTVCPAGETTYPDPRTCCPLDSSGACATLPPVMPEDAGSGAGGGGGCQYTCPPGWYVEPGADPATGPVVCCLSTAAGATTCVISPMATTSPTCGVCACPSCIEADGATCPCTCPEPDPNCMPSTCAACPEGWEVPTGDPNQCCRQPAGGPIMCFSQAVPPPGGGSADAGGPVTSGDAGPPQPLDAGGVPTTIACGAAANTHTDCSCSGQIGGTTYGFDCAAGATTCTCTVDGAPGKTVPAFSTTGSIGMTSACSDPTGTFSECGFPQQ